MHRYLSLMVCGSKSKTDRKMESIPEPVKDYVQVMVRHHMKGVLRPVAQEWVLDRMQKLGLLVKVLFMGAVTLMFEAALVSYLLLI